jgi:hypothetical protein
VYHYKGKTRIEGACPQGTEKNIWVVAEGRGRWRKLLNEKLHSLTASQQVIRMTSWAGHVAHMGDSFEVQSEKMKGRDHVGYERLMLRWVLGKEVRPYGTGSLMRASSVRLC